MPVVCLASVGLEPLVVRMCGNAGTVLRVVRHGLEHLFDARPVSRVRSSVEMDVVPALRRMVPARGLVRVEGVLRKLICAASERANEPRERSAPAKRRARERVGESEGRSPSVEHRWDS